MPGNAFSPRSEVTSVADPHASDRSSTVNGVLFWSDQIQEGAAGDFSFPTSKYNIEKLRIFYLYIA
jgi:hypothetical protein